MKLKTEQQRLYEILMAEKQCFVRVCEDDGALWVSDLPRKTDCVDVIEKLRVEGFDGRVADTLLYVDWTEEQWRKFTAALPESSPALPLPQEVHEAYALCRLLIHHPSERTQAHMPMLRRVVKLTQKKTPCLLKAVRSLYEEAAVQIRNHQTVACDAGRVLAKWIQEYVCEREGQP